jgi:hypothetical protein
LVRPLSAALLPVAKQSFSSPPEARDDRGARFPERMKYRRLGKSGLKITKLSFGAWIRFAQQITDETPAELMAIGYDPGDPGDTRISSLR